MSLLWLLPAAVLVAALPFLVAAVRTLRDQIEALHREVQALHGQLSPALVRVRADGARLAHHRSAPRR